MKKSDDVTQLRLSQQREGSQSTKNPAYLIGDLIHNWRSKRARSRGAEPIIVPSVGYGSTEWVRVIGRALYKTDPFEEMVQQDAPAESLRGWRSFTSVAVSNAAVTVTLAGQTFEVIADEGGVIDARIDVSLEPGIHDMTMEMSGSPVAITSVYIVSPDQKYGVITDVDDTVMITALPRPMVAGTPSCSTSTPASPPPAWRS